MFSIFQFGNSGGPLVNLVSSGFNGLQLQCSVYYANAASVTKSECSSMNTG